MMQEWQQRDLRHIWHPCSQMKDAERYPPIVVQRGQGVWLHDVDGKRYLDAISSWWTNLFGHGEPRMAEAIARQARELEHVIFADFSHQPAIQLAERITALLPPGLTRVFFADNGSSAVEVALKLSFQYHQQVGQPQKTMFASITGAYHGETLGALAAGDLDLYSQVFRPIMMKTVRVQGPDCFRCPHGQERTTCNAECFVHMERTLEAQHSVLSAVIIEPMVQCAAGMRISSPVYLRKLREACTRYGVHLIADEIAVGFGRTGRMFAMEHAGITPDMVCLSKGLTGGFLPLSLTVTNQQIYDVFYADYTELKAFMHSHSYTGNPLACAAALAGLSIFEEDRVLESNARKAEGLRRAVEARAAEHPHIGEYRQLGMIGALELVRHKQSKEGFDWKMRVGHRVYRTAVERGLLLRPLGNVLYFMPPYCIQPEEVDWMVQTAFEAINATMEQLR